jgi:DNA repair exonuclease SbcCD nuclease subunit
MPRLLLIGDQHIRHDNLHAVQRLETWLSEQWRHEGFTHIVLMGDLLDRHTHVEQPLLARADRLLRHILSLDPSIHLIVLCGNHDMAHNQVFLTPDHWLIVYQHNGLERLTIVDKPTQVPTLNGLLFMPYVPDGRFIEALDSSYPDWKARFTALFCHQSFTNIQSIGHLLKDADTWLSEYPLAISGHIHDSHWASANLLYTGSYIPVSNGESNDKRLWLVDYDCQRHLLTTPRSLPVNFLLRTTIEVNQPADVMTILQDKPLDPNQHTRLVIKGTAEQIASWTRSMDAATLRAHKNVKIVMRMISTPKAESKENEEKHSVPSERKESFVSLLEGALETRSAVVQQLWTEFRAQHVNLFQ